jgi:hypothetical protein
MLAVPFRHALALSPRRLTLRQVACAIPVLPWGNKERLGSLLRVRAPSRLERSAAAQLASREHGTWYL